MYSSRARYDNKNASAPWHSCIDGQLPHTEATQAWRRKLRVLCENWWEQRNAIAIPGASAISSSSVIVQCECHVGSVQRSLKIQRLDAWSCRRVVHTQDGCSKMYSRARQSRQGALCTESVLIYCFLNNPPARREAAPRSCNPLPRSLAASRSNLPRLLVGADVLEASLPRSVEKPETIYQTD